MDAALCGARKERDKMKLSKLAEFLKSISWRSYLKEYASFDGAINDLKHFINNNWNSSYKKILDILYKMNQNEKHIDFEIPLIDFYKNEYFIKGKIKSDDRLFVLSTLFDDYSEFIILAKNEVKKKLSESSHGINYAITVK